MRHLLLFALLVCAFCFLGCKKADKESAKGRETIELTDYYGRKLNIPTNPEKVVSLSPGITELIFDLGVSDRLVGRTDYCLYPEKAKLIPSVGGITDANVELIIAKQPDVVFTASMVARQSVNRLEKAGIRVVCLPERKRVADVYRTVSLLGKIFCKEQLADSLIENMKTQIESLQKKNVTAKRPSVYYVAGFGAGGDFTAGGDSFINDIISLAGGENIAKDVSGWSISREAIFARKPDFIVVRKEDAERFVKTAPYNKLEAVKRGNVIPIESSLTDCQTLRTPLAIEKIGDFMALRCQEGR